MTEEKARTIAAEAGTAVGRWRNAATRHGLTPDEAERLHWALVPLQGGDPITPADVYVRGQAVGLPK